MGHTVNGPDAEFWRTYVGVVEGATVHVRIEDRAGRIAITEMYVRADDEVDAAMLRSIPIGRMEAAVNLGWGREGEVMQFEASSASAGDAPTLEELRLRTPAKAPRRKRRKPLTRPDGRDPDAFYAAVAAAYREYAPETKAPGAAIAKEAGVPATTAHRWVREARRRGFLGAGRQGKSG